MRRHFYGLFFNQIRFHKYCNKNVYIRFIEHVRNVRNEIPEEEDHCEHKKIETWVDYYIGVGNSHQHFLSWIIKLSKTFSSDFHVKLLKFLLASNTNKMKTPIHYKWKFLKNQHLIFGIFRFSLRFPTVCSHFSRYLIITHKYICLPIHKILRGGKSERLDLLRV